MAALSSADRTFATKAAHGGQAEVVLGQLVTQDTTAASVKQFGERMITDHRAGQPGAGGYRQTAES
jgi:putative membrane protein